MDGNSGLKNAVKVDQIKTYGSSSINTRNEFGVYIFSGSVGDDGIIYSQLTRPNYNTTELLKTIDTNIFELLPPPAPVVDDLVPRVWWTDEQSAHNITKEVVRVQSIQIDNLNNRIDELHAVSQSLRIELDSQSLIAAAAQNQAAQSTSRVKTSITELQNAIQKSTSEVIQRVSLSVLNKTLQDQINILNDQLFGRTSKREEGYKVATDFAAKTVQQSETNTRDIILKTEAGDWGASQWVNGPSIDIYNFTNNSITVSFERIQTADVIFSPIPNLTIPANSSKVVAIQPVSREVIDRIPLSTNLWENDTDYRGSIKITSLNTGTYVTLTTSLYAVRGAFTTPNIKYEI